MGTDIHMVVEYMDHGVWTPAPVNGYEARNYSLFTQLAGVCDRGDYNAIVAPRGFPEGFKVDKDHRTIDKYLPEISYNLFYDIPWTENPAEYATRWLGDHTHSWLTYEELERVECSYQGWKTFMDLLDKELRGWKKNKIPVRVVFGFDS